MTLVLTLQWWMLVPTAWVFALLWFMLNIGNIELEDVGSAALVWLATGGSAILARLLP